MLTWKFAFITDIHVGSPRSFRFAPAWNENWQTARAQIIETNPDFLLLGGDLTRDGNIHRYEMENIKADLDNLPFPFHTVPGNMDTGNKHTPVQGALSDRNDLSLNVTSQQVKTFEEIFGSSHWSFIHKGVRFTGICDMLINSNLPEEKILWDWLEKLKEEPPEKYHVFVMHYALFIDSLDEKKHQITNPDEYLLWYFSMDEPGRSRLYEYFKTTGVTNVLTGHIHCRKVHYVDNIRFDLCPALSVGQLASQWEDGDTTFGFLKVEVSDQGLKPTFVPLKKVSTLKGYGPTGHPKEEERDYSIAWEK